MKSCARDGDAAAGDRGEPCIRLFRHIAARDGDEIDAAVDGLQEHRRCGAGDLDGTGFQRRRHGGVEGDDLEVDVQPVFFEQPFVLGHHGGHVGVARRMAEHELFARRRSAGRGRQRQHNSPHYCKSVSHVAPSATVRRSRRHVTAPSEGKLVQKS